MLALLALVLMAPPTACKDRPCQEHGRESRRMGNRGKGGVAYAMFEFAPTGGANMGAACACTPVAGAKGEILTYTRASVGTCTKGHTTSGIRDGDLVVCASGQPRVMPGGDGTGPLGILMESAKANRILRSAELCDAAWSDVGTPNCSSDAQTGPFGTTTMDQLTDNDAAAFEGRSQPYVSSSQNARAVSCYVKAGTATSATITLVGTGNSAGDCTGTVTGLSTTTSKRISCVGAAYGAGITSALLTIKVGTNASDTGTLFVEGCQHESNAPYVSSYVPTTSAQVTRAIDALTYPTTNFAASSTLSVAATIVPLWTPTTVSFTPGIVTMNGANGSTLYVTTALRFLTGATANPNSALTTTVPARVYGYDNGTNAVNAYDTNTNSVASGAAASRWGTSMGIGDGAPAGVGALDGVIKQVCVDPNPSRCR